MANQPPTPSTPENKTAERGQGAAPEFKIEELFIQPIQQDRELESLLREVINTPPRQVLARIYKVLNRHVISPNLDIAYQGLHYNSSLLLTMLTCLTGGKAILFGPSGTGKSTIVENVTQILFGDRLEDIQGATIQCHQNLTVENLEKSFLGTFISDESKSPVETGGYEKKNLHHSSILFIDDLSSLSPPMQTIFNTLLEEGLLVVNNIRYALPRKPTFATSNLLDLSDVRSKALHDRFQVSMVPTGLNPSWFRRLFAALPERNLNQYSLNLGEDDLKNIQREIRDIAIDPLVLAKVEFFFAEMSHCTQISESITYKNRANAFFDAVQDLSHLCQACPLLKQNPKIICGSIKGTISTRALSALVNYAKAFAWIAGENSITSDRLIESILPFTLLHRLEPSRLSREENPHSLARVPWLMELWRRAVENFESMDERIDDFKSVLTQIMDDTITLAEKQSILEKSARELLRWPTPARYNYLTLLMNRAYEFQIPLKIPGQ